MALAENNELRTVKHGGQEIVSGTQRCTKFLAAVQDGIDLAAQTLFDAAKRLVEVGSADCADDHGLPGAIAAQMYDPSWRS